MTKKNHKSAKVMASFVLLLVVAVLGSFQLAKSFSGVAKYNIEVWNGNVVESADQAQQVLGGVTFEKEVFPNGLQTSALTYGSVSTISSGSLALSAAQICDNSLIQFDGDGYASAAAYRFPTAAQLITRCLPNIGDARQVFMLNTSADEVFSFTVGVGMDAWIASSSANAVSDLFNNVTVDAGVIIRFLNVDGSSVSLTFEEVRDSD